jgi:hypothetical protein
MSLKGEFPVESQEKKIAQTGKLFIPKFYFWDPSGVKKCSE